MKNQLSLIFVGFIVLVGCSKQPTFTVSGTLTNAQDQTIYLERTALLATTIVDSCHIDTDGNFSLKASAPTFPDFYRLRIGSRSLPLAIDSTEQVQVTTSLDSMPYTLNIIGSEASLQIAQLRASARTETREVLREQTQKLILSNPRSLIAYYALFFKHNGTPLWDMTDPSDRRLYQAVATSYNLWMPEYNRTKALYNQVLEHMQTERSMRSQLAAQQLIAESENAFLDITLSDAKGQTQPLSKYRGKVIILDFSSTEMEQYVAYNFELRELYNQYHKRGLEIYSVSIDRNQLAWEDATEHLPWTIVRAYENDAVQVLTQYNVHSLPTLFLFDREGNVQGRYTDFTALEADINKYL
jgi:peroxiredoxin